MFNSQHQHGSSQTFVNLPSDKQTGTRSVCDIDIYAVKDKKNSNKIKYIYKECGSYIPSNISKGIFHFVLLFPE